MTLTTTALFLLAAIGLAIWMKKDPGFRRREFIAVSVFWILFSATPWGAELINAATNAIGTGVTAGSDTVNQLSN